MTKPRKVSTLEGKKLLLHEKGGKNESTVKILKFGTPQTIAIIVLKIETFNVTLMHPKDADGLANSVDPDQTASSEAV